MIQYCRCFLFLLMVVFVQSEIKKPNGFPRCDINSKDLNKCLLQATEDIREILARGAPELNNMLPVKERLIEKVDLKQDTKSLSYSAAIHNSTLYGVEDYKFSKLEFADNKLLLDFVIPHLYVTSVYELTGKVLMSAINAKGFFKSNSTNLHCIMTVTLKEVFRNNVKYLEAADIKSKITIDDIDIDFDGIYGGNPTLEAAAKKVIIDNKKELLHEFIPVFEDSVEKVVEENLFNHILKIPYDELFITN